MKEIQNPPYAPSLMESMRSIGYSLEAALADLIDNSISARAKKISIEFRTVGTPYVAIIDDGVGMTESILETAMRHGSTSPLQQRDRDDLGRYGLGLKTASLSQCRRMTVTTLQDGKLSACCWDLDIVATRKEWVMLVLDEDDIQAIPHINMLHEHGSGTIVLWQNLDKLAAGEASIESALGNQMEIARDHLALVFHRYINPETGRNRLAMVINRNPLAALDPFLLDHSATQVLDNDDFSVEGHKVMVKPFILPHISKLSPPDLARAGGPDGLRNLQGFYVYRNRRLIIWGTWFRLAKKDELGKLARVRVDIPNALDHLWTLDIKKSAAHPPDTVRQNLRRIIEQIRGRSGNTIRFRGRVKESAALAPTWREVDDRTGFRFDINRNHPLIQSFSDRLSEESAIAFRSVLGLIEASLPIEALYVRMASENKPAIDPAAALPKLREIACNLVGVLAIDSPIRESLLDNLHNIEPFNLHAEATRKIIEELKKNG